MARPEVLGWMVDRQRRAEGSSNSHLEIDAQKFNDFGNSSGYCVIKIDTERYADMPGDLYYMGNKVFTDGYNEYAPNTIYTMAYVAKELTSLIRETRQIGEQLNW